MSTNDLPPLSPEELRRYSRHLVLPEVSLAGQRKLKAGRVLVVGAGGLGSPVGLYLAAAGVGTLGVADFDVVDESNLQRQVIHGTPDVGHGKADSARQAMLRVNPLVNVVAHRERLTPANALEIVRGYDVVVDGSDNFPTRYLVNDTCVLLGRPDVYGSVFRFEGQASVFAAPAGPCYRCLHPDPPPPGLIASCAEAGVLGVLPGVIGMVQATEAIKLLVGVGQPLVGRLLLYDALTMSFSSVSVERDPACPACGERPRIRELMDDEELTDTTVDALRGLRPAQLKARLDSGEQLVLLDVREPHEFPIANLPGAVRIPVGELPMRICELDRDATLVVYCHRDLRSAWAVRYLREAGFRHALNLAGGIDAWAAEVEPGMARY